jgi:beta-glucosidase
MSRSVLAFPSVVTPILAMVVAASCGHSNEAMEAFNRSKTGITTTNAVDPTDNPDTTEVNPDQSDAVNPDTTNDDPSKPQFACDAVRSQQFDTATMKGYRVPANVKAEVNRVLQQMTPAQKATQMMGIPVGGRDYRDIERSPDVEVAGVGTIRGYRYRDAGRGVNLDAGQDNRASDMKNYATAFPSPSLRAASWDLDLERRIGAAIGDETAASKNNMLLAPCMNIVRHPYWGRTQETYGEDMYAVGRMATALTVGLQEYVVACPKHFAANNIEKERARQNALMSEQTLREIYGRHFEMVVQDGAAGCIMASYNLVNGVKATQSPHLLRKVLKAPLSEGGMGFDGLVLTDWWAMPGDQNDQDAPTALSVTKEAVLAGTDVEVPWQLHYSEATLTSPEVNQEMVTDAARRVLTQKYLFKSALTTDGWSLKAPTSTLTGGSITPSDAHETLAEETVVKSAVLVTNGLDDSSEVLPLPDATAKIAVVGLIQTFQQISSSVPPICGYDAGTGQGQTGARSCDFNHVEHANLGDRGSSRVNADPARSISILRGLQEVAVGKTVVGGNTVESVGDADTVVVVVGYTPGDEGEEYYIQAGGDRASLDLPPGQNDFVQQVLDLDKPTVIVVQSGSIINLPWLAHANKKQATVWAGYPAMRGGSGVARLLLGQDNFAGKMPMAWPTEDLLPVFKDTPNETTMGYYFGYRDYDKRKYVDGQAINLLFPFGHGLSYSSFTYSNVVAPCDAVTKEAIFEVTVDIENNSDRDGDEVAFLFVKPPPKPANVTGDRPWKELKSFARVPVPAGQKVTAKLPLRIQDLRRWEGGADGKWVIDSGVYTLAIGKDSEDAETTTNTATITVNGD